jgi:hypothetical protein
MPIKIIKLIRVVGLLVVAAAFASVWVRSLEAAASSRYQAGDSRVALVVRFSDDDVYTQCVSFSEPEFSLDDLLLRASLSAEIDENSAICRINNTGCPLDNCRCGWNETPPIYWAYFKWDNGRWLYQYPDVVNIPVAHGDLFGFSWGPGDLVSAIPTPVYTYDQICVSGIPPTATLTATATWPLAQPTTPVAPPLGQPGDALPLPQVTFTADSPSIAWGICTVLRWDAWDATQVTVNGTPVTGQEWLEVCPEVTERFVLVAANSTGQTAQEVQVEVIGTDLQPQPGAALPVPTPAQMGVPGAAVIPGATPIPQPILALAASSPTASPAPTVYFAFAPTATLTPRPRRILGADGGPTPTPLLVARAGRPAQEAPTTGTTTGAPPMLPVVDRAFSVALLPGYAAYLILAASLASACVWVIRRRASAIPER